MRSIALSSLAVFVFAIASLPLKANTVYQTLIQGETLTVEGMQTVKFTKAGRVALADLNLLYISGKNTRSYPVSVRLSAVDSYKVKEGEAQKSHTFQSSPKLSIADNGQVDVKIDRNDDGTVKKVKVTLKYKITDPQGVFQELKFESEDVADIYTKLYEKAAQGAGASFADSLAKRALSKIFVDNLKWETLQAGAREKLLSLSTGTMPPNAVVMPATTVIQNPVEQHKAGLLKVKGRFKAGQDTTQ